MKPRLRPLPMCSHNPKSIFSFRRRLECIWDSPVEMNLARQSAYGGCYFKMDINFCNGVLPQGHRWFSVTWPCFCCIFDRSTQHHSLQQVHVTVTQHTCVLKGVTDASVTWPQIIVPCSGRVQANLRDHKSSVNHRSRDLICVSPQEFAHNHNKPHKTHKTFSLMWNYAWETCLDSTLTVI